MGLKDASISKLTETRNALDHFLGDKELLSEVREFLSRDSLTDEERTILKCYEKTFLCYIIENPTLSALKKEITSAESELANYRNQMNLGYVCPETKELVLKSSVQLRNLLRSSESESERRACYEGLRSVGPYVAEKFCRIVTMRSQFARAIGYSCFYDMKVSQSEGFGKAAPFTILDELEERSRPLLAEALERLRLEKGAAALEPHNTGFLTSGDLTRLKDPDFPFASSVDVWSRSFAGLGIDLTCATARASIRTDFATGHSRPGGNQTPQKSTCKWVPSEANFTSLATPGSVGSGYTSLVTLMHEGGHAAHFANVNQGSPLFSQERAPTSVAYAENQSMFLDSLVGDAAWQGRYALSAAGEAIPWDIVEKNIRDVHKYEVFTLRSLISIPYFEKRLSSYQILRLSSIRCDAAFSFYIRTDEPLDRL